MRSIKDEAQLIARYLRQKLFRQRKVQNKKHPSRANLVAAFRRTFARNMDMDE